MGNSAGPTKEKGVAFRLSSFLVSPPPRRTEACTSPTQIVRAPLYAASGVKTELAPNVNSKIQFD
jgi:hypothetical protein